jgi:8-oxo-dGTP pyrophosphatase MutT (NUDIX family)
MASIDRELTARLAPIGDWEATTLPRAAVLCPLVEHAGSDHILLLVRPTTMRRHAGQIGFPGGRRDRDETMAATALRECHEEIGVPASAVTLLGQLASRVSSSGMLVHALVARLAPVPIVPDANEVARVLLVPLADLRDEARWQERPPPGDATGQQLPTSPCFRCGDDQIWGLTGRFLFDLVQRLNGKAP